MQNNPREFVMIIFENAAELPGETLEPLLAPLSSYAYVPTSPQTFPTLGELINSGKRMMFFNYPSPGTSTFVLPAFNYLASTAFDVFSSSGFNCTIQRPAGQTRPFLVLNHMLSTPIIGNEIYIPNFDARETTNSAESLKAHLQSCGNTFVNFLYVDWGQTGDLMKVTAEYNGVAWNGKTSDSPIGTKPPGTASHASSILRSGFSVLAVVLYLFN